VRKGDDMKPARTKSVTLRLDMDLNAQLDRYCRGTNFTKSLLVNCAVANFIRASEKDRREIVRDYVRRARVKR